MRTGPALLVLALLAGPAAARDGRDTAVQAAIDRVSADWRILLTCTATDARTHDMLAKSWRKEVELTRLGLLAIGWSEAEADRFAAAHDPARMVARELPYGQVITLCRFNAGLVLKARRMGLERLHEAVEEAINR